jgi:hypothetical protein
MYVTRKLLLGVGAIASTAFIVIACGSSDESKFGDGNGKDGSSNDIDGAFNNGDGSKPDGGDPYANDPPPPWCGPPGQPEPPKPGGTVECPDDKNKPGCGCTEVGKQAACWTGLRANRNIGICKDGVTTCQQVNENVKAWGPCEGEVLPKQGATKGADACKCFSAGQWKIANLSPCFITYTNEPPQATDGTYAVSTHDDGTGTAKCPTVAQGSAPPPTPNGIWSTDTLKVDCVGHFKLCLRIRQGVFETPNPNDCILAEVCTESDYLKENVEQPWPDLPGWQGKSKECAEKWNAIPDTVSAGYAEMIVKGKSVRCDNIDDGNGGDLIFNRIKYCPKICRTNPTTPECQACQQSGQGGF